MPPLPEQIQDQDRQSGLSLTDLITGGKQVQAPKPPAAPTQAPSPVLQQPTTTPAAAPTTTPKGVPQPAAQATPQPGAQQQTAAPDWEAAMPAIAQRHGLDPELMRRVIQAESAGDIGAADYKTGTHLGLMQLSPQLVKQYGIDPKDPYQNMGVGASELARLLKKYNGHYGRALAAYNAGETAVDGVPDGIPNIPETQAYVMKILQGYTPPQAKAAAEAAQGGAQQAPGQAPRMMAPPPGFNMYQYNPQGPEMIKRGLAVPGGLFGPPTAQEEAQAQATSGLIGDPKDLGKAFEQVQAAPEKFMQPSAGMSISGATPFSPVAAGMVQPGTVGAGVAEGVAGLASPSNIIQLAAIPESKLINLFFTGQMGTDTAQALWHAKQAQAAGNQQAANELYGQALVSGGMTLLTALGLRPGKAAGGELQTGQAPEMQGYRYQGPSGQEGVPRPEITPPGVTPGPEPSGPQATPPQAPALGREGGPGQVTQAGQTAAQEVTGGRVPAAASAPIEGGGGTTGTVTPKPTGAGFEEKRTGPQVSLPAGFERRGIKTPEQVQQEAQGNLAAQTADAAAKREQYSVQERSRQAELRILKDPELSKVFRKASPQEKQALIAHVAGLQIAELQPPPGGAQPRAGRGTEIVQGKAGLAKTTAPTPTAAAQPAAEPIRTAQEPTGAPGEPVRPGQAGAGQPVRQPAEIRPQQAAKFKPYTPLPPEQRPFVPAGGGAPRFEQPKPEARPTEQTKSTEAVPVAPTPTPAAVPSAPAQPAAEVFTSKGGKSKPGAIGPTMSKREAAGTVDRVLTRHLKVEGGRLDELGKAISAERAKGPEQARRTSQDIAQRGQRAQSYLDSLDRLAKSEDWDKEIREELNARSVKDEVDPDTGKFIPGRNWVTEEGVQGGTRKGGTLNFTDTFSREANARRAEVLNDLRGNRTREVGKATELLPHQRMKLEGLQREYKTLMEQTRLEGGRPSDERLAQLEKMMEGIHALRGTRRLATGEQGTPLGLDTDVGATGERKPIGTGASRGFLRELMGWPEKGGKTRPTPEQLQARIAELKNEVKWSANTSRALVEGLEGAGAAPAAEQPRPLKPLAGREEPTSTPQKPGWGESNTKFTKDKLQAAREKFRNAGKTSYAGLDPELVKALTDIVGYHFEAGLREFGRLAEQVVADLGEHVRPYLRDIYDNVKAGFEGPAKTPAATPAEPVQPAKPAAKGEVAKPPAEAGKTPPSAPAPRAPDTLQRAGVSRAPKKGGYLRINEPTPAFKMTEDKALSDIANMPREVREAFYGLRPQEQKEFVERYRAGGHPEQELYPERLPSAKRAEPEQEIIEQRRPTVPQQDMRRYEAASAEARGKYEKDIAGHKARLEEVRQLRAVDPQDYTPAYIDRLAKFGKQLKDAEGKNEFLGKVEEARTAFSSGDAKAGHAAVTSALAMADQRLLEPRAPKLFEQASKRPPAAPPARVRTESAGPREPGIGKRVYDAFIADASKGLREFSTEDLRKARESFQGGEGTRKGIDAELARREAEKGEIEKLAPKLEPVKQAPRKEAHVRVDVKAPEGSGGKADTAREQVYDVARRIDALPKGEERNALAQRINEFSKKLEDINEGLRWTNRAIEEMRASGENVRTRVNKKTGEQRTETLQQLEMRAMKLGQARTDMMLEKPRSKGAQKGAPAYDTIAAIRDTVSAMEKPAVTPAPKPTETVQKPQTVIVHGHERVIDPKTGKLVEQLAPVIGVKKDAIPSPAPTEEGVQQRIEQLKKEAQHLAGLYNKFGGQPTRSAAIDIGRLKKSIKAISASIPKNMLPELPESVQAALKAGQLLTKAVRQEPKARTGEVIEGDETEGFKTGVPSGAHKEDLTRWLASKAASGPEVVSSAVLGKEHAGAIPPAVMKYIDENLNKAGVAGDYISEAIMASAKRGELGDIRGDKAASVAAHRLYRALAAYFKGRTAALAAPEGERASLREQAMHDAMQIAKTGSKDTETLAQRRARLAREKPGERGFFSFGGGRRNRQGANNALARLFGRQAGAQQAGGQKLMERMRETSDAFHASRLLDEGLEERRFQQQGMRQRFMQGLKDLPKIPGLQKAMYKLSELSPKSGQFSVAQFQKVFDDHIRDWADLAEQRYLQLRNAGHQVDNYVPKYAIKKNTMWDRILRGKGQYTMGSALRQTASALHGRSFLRLEAPGIPADTIVHEDRSGNLTLWDNKQPTPLGMNRKEMEANGWKFTTAKTDDITKHSGQEYLQHLYIATASKAMELDNAWRAHEFMEAYKASPEFQQYAVKAPPGAPVPDGFKYTRVPQLQGYAFEKHTADVLERYYDSLDHNSGNFLDKFNYGLMSTIYWNPLKHAKNILDHFATYHGLSTFVDPKQAAPMVRAWRKAWRAVIDGNSDYLYGLDMGMPLRGRMVSGGDMTEAILKELNPVQMVRNAQGQWVPTAQASALAKAWGRANPVSLYKSYMRAQRRVLFGLDDILRLQAVYHHQEMTGASFKESWKEVSKHLPDYTLPTHIGLRVPGTDIDVPSRALAKAFESRAVIFGRYHYGRMKSYGYMAQDISSKTVPSRERWKTVDRLLVPAISLALYATLGKMAAQKMTGKKDAEMAPSGATAIPWMTMRLLQGKTSIGRTAMSTFTPNPLVDLAARMGYGELSRPKPIGEQIKEAIGFQGDVTKPSSVKLTGGLLGEIGPVREAEQTKRGIQGQVDWAEVLRRAALNVYVPKGGAESRRSLPRLPHFPRRLR